MEWIEAEQLPEERRDCREGDCYNCDHAAERRYLHEIDQLKLQRKGLLKAIERNRRKVAAIEKELKEKYGITQL